MWWRGERGERVAQAKAEPVRVKLYGFYSITKRKYVAQVVVAAVMIAFLFVAWLIFHQSLRDRLLALSVPVLDTVVKVWDTVPWIVLTLAVLQVIEAYFVFRASPASSRHRHRLQHRRHRMPPVIQRRTRVNNPSRDSSDVGPVVSGRLGQPRVASACITALM